MIPSLHSLRTTKKQRSKSQNTSTNFTQQNSLDTFNTIKYKLKQAQFHTQLKIHQPPNVLLNGKRLHDITYKSKYMKTTTCSPKNNTPYIQQYIYRKFLTENQQEINPPAQAIMRIRQMFNQAKVRNQSQIKQIQVNQNSNFCTTHFNFTAKGGLTNPDLNSLTYISKAKKYCDKTTQQKSYNRYFKVLKQKKRQKMQKIIPCSVNDRLSIDPWETQ